MDTEYGIRMDTEYGFGRSCGWILNMALVGHVDIAL